MDDQYPDPYPNLYGPKPEPLVPQPQWEYVALSDSFLTWVKPVWKYWRLAMVSSLVIGVGFVFLDVFTRGARVAIVGAVILVFLFFAMFKSWRDERRARMAAPMIDLMRDIRPLSDTLDQFIELRRADGKTSFGLSLMSDNWLTQINDHTEVVGRDLRHRIRIQNERLSKLGLSTPTIDEGISDLLEIKKALRNREEFLRLTARRILDSSGASEEIL